MRVEEKDIEIPGGLRGSSAAEFVFHLFKKIAAASGDEPVLYFQKAIEKDGAHQADEIFIGFEAFEIISARADRVTITHAGSHGGDHFEVQGNPFAIVDQRLKKYAVKADSLNRFRGGGAGFFGYDSVRFIEPVLQKAPGAFRAAANDHLDACVVLFRKFFRFNEPEQKLTCISLSAPDILIESDDADVFHDHLTFVKSAATDFREKKWADGKLMAAKDRSVEDMKASLGRAAFLNGVAKLKEHIVAGDIFQAVLAERFEFIARMPALSYFEALMSTSRSAYQFYLACGGRAYMGSSPEMLLRVSGSDLETHPIAGTRPRGKTEDEERKFEVQLRKSPKENAEHLMLVDLARNDVGRIAIPGSVRVTSKMEIKKFPGVMHLVSKVVGKKSEKNSALEALMACFPAGTLSGAPKIRAMELLSEIEKKPRGFYGGAMTLLGFDGNLDSCISIRCIEINGSRGFIQAGAGVVADSSAEREYEEVLHKTRTVRQAVELAEQAGSKDDDA